MHRAESKHVETDRLHRTEDVVHRCDFLFSNRHQTKSKPVDKRPHELDELAQELASMNIKETKLNKDKVSSGKPKREDLQLIGSWATEKYQKR